MDFSFDNVKREKANAMMRYRRVRKIANMFRLFEVVLALILISWFSTQLPFVVEIFGKYFKKLCVVVISPRFVFVIGNAIIITLFLKSDQFSGKSSNSNNEEVNLYEEFVKNSENRQKICMEVPSSSSSLKDEIVFEDKETVCEVSSVHPVSVPVPRDSPPRSPRQSKPRDVQRKSYRRTQSENMKSEVVEKPAKALRRSETDKCRTFGGKDSVRSSVGEKELSNEEFQRTVEAFIAKQAMFRWEESMAIVLQNQS